VIAKLEPLSEQHALVKFIRNIDNAKILSGFVQELANAVEHYQVCAPSPEVTFIEHPARFHYTKECIRGQGKSMMKPRTSMMTPRTS
jgi:hypothetical protein